MEKFDLACPTTDAHTQAVPVPVGGIAKGDIASVGDVITFALIKGEEATSPELEPTRYYTAVIQAKQVTAKKDANPIGQGVKVYYDSALQVVTASDGGGANDWIGYANEAAIATEETVNIYFDGNLVNTV